MSHDRSGFCWALNRRAFSRVWIVAVFVAVCSATAEEERHGGPFLNSVNMTMVPIGSGSFRQGTGVTPLPDDLVLGHVNRKNGDYDEGPSRTVHIAHEFFMSSTEVTNAQYEEFDPGHRKLRGYMNFSHGDDEAVVFVTHDDALAYTAWLSKRENRYYRLPTEAEWEYACRAGTSTYFNTGNEYPQKYWKNQHESWYPDPLRSNSSDVVSLQVASFPPNAFGLYDMHGNVEEWCLDWYTPSYDAEATTNPVGPRRGTFRVTRGGSHSTEVYFLRSGNRLGALPYDKSWVIGFRVVAADPDVPLHVHGEPTTTTIAPILEQSALDRAVDEPKSRADEREVARSHRRHRAAATFHGPAQYVNIDPHENGPLFPQHNHDPALAVCPNGDLLAIHFTTVEERGRECGMAAARLPRGRTQWEKTFPLWDTPDRLDCCPAMMERNGELYQWMGISASVTWGNLAVLQRISHDCGHVYHDTSLVMPEHTLRHQPVETAITLSSGALLLPTDNTTRGSGGTAIHISRNGGSSWEDPGGNILGIHGCVVERRDGSLLAYGRGNDIDGMVAQSESVDTGKTWKYSASPFPGIIGGQRHVVLRLRDGDILYCSFANDPMTFRDDQGGTFTGVGLYCALSSDDGYSYYARRLITPGGSPRSVETLDGELFTLSSTSAEPKGYLAVQQDRFSEVIHLISSRQHYAFTPQWIREFPAPPQ